MAKKAAAPKAAQKELTVAESRKRLADGKSKELHFVKVRNAWRTIVKKRALQLKHVVERRKKTRAREAEQKQDGGPEVMYDSVTVSEIPKKAKAVAGYVGGSWPTYGDLEGNFPHVLSIAVNASEDAECLDIETGDATPSDAAAWVRRQKARGVKRPVVYASASVMPEVLTNLSRFKRTSYRIWTAHYDGKHICGPTTCKYIDVDADATQWTDTSLGRNLDESYLRKDFFA